MLCPLVSASFIGIQTQIITPNLIEESNSSIEIMTTNRGDETAKNVFLEFTVPAGFLVDNRNIGSIMPEQSVNSTIQISIPEGAAGSYPLIVKTNYADSNEYGYSSLTSSYLNIKSVKSKKILIKSEDITLKGSDWDSIKVEVINIDSKDQEVKVGVFVPDEILVEENTKIFKLPTKGTELIEFKVKNLAGNPSSNYVGAITVEYDDEEHFTIIKPITISLVSDSSIYLIALALLLVVLIVISIYFQVYKKKKRKR